MLGVLLRIDSYDPVAGEIVSLRASSLNDPAVCHLNGETWWPVLGKLPEFVYDLGGAADGKIATPSSKLTMAVEPWPLFGRYMLADAKIRIWTGEAGDAWSSWTLRFDGRVGQQPKLAKGIADVEFAVDDGWLDLPLFSLYAGTGGAEGPAALKGAVKPLCLGQPRYVPGTLIDSVNSVWQLSGYGAIEDVEAALERLARYAASTGDYATFAGLIGATIPPGRWASSKALGLVRFGAPPTGTVSFLVKGDKAGGSTAPRTPGALMARIADVAGKSGVVDTASMSALDTARPYNCSRYLGEQTTARELLSGLAASVNAAVGISWLGKLFALPVGFGTPTLTLKADGTALPIVGKVERLETGPPYARLAMAAERTWEVHAYADVAFTAALTDVGAYSADTTYREGNIATLSDGSRWLYISTTPAAGNAPSIGSAYWSQLAGATQVDFKDVTGGTKPDANATRNNAIYDPMAYATPAKLSSGWSTVGPGTTSIVASSDLDGRAARTTGYANWYANTYLPYSPEDLYRIDFDIELGGSGTGAETQVLYAGVQALDVNGNNLASDAGTFCYFAALNWGYASGSGRRTFTGYFRGTANPGGGAGVGGLSPDPANPTPAPTGTVRIRPLILAGYASTPGGIVALTTVHEVSLGKVDDATVIWIGAYASGRTYRRNEGVSYLGRSFASRADGNLNHTPPSTAASDANWFLVSDRGATGDTGDTARRALRRSHLQT